MAGLTGTPQVQTSDRNNNQLQSNILKTLTVLSGNALMNGIFLNSVSISSGANTINHKLGRNLIGWIVTGINAAVTLYDTQASNKTPGLTLNLTASGTATVNLYVF
jgi:hypothetical protein